MLNDAPLALKPQEYDLLLFFAEHKGHMLSREFGLERVWGWDYVGDGRTVDVHVRWLRQKIEANPANPIRIVTVRGGKIWAESVAGRCLFLHYPAGFIREASCINKTFTFG